MTKQKSRQKQGHPMDKILLGKPDFGQALSFAESKPDDRDGTANENRHALHVSSPDVKENTVSHVAMRGGLDEESGASKAQHKLNANESISSRLDVTDSSGLAIQLPEHPERVVQPLSASALMPQDAATRKILAERALVIARPVSNQRHEQRDQYLRFRLGTVERYGIPYQYLEELLYVVNLARVPCTPKFVAGVINHCGELLTIIDIKQFFRMPAIALNKEARIIVVKHAGIRAGLLVDEVDGNKEYQDSELSPPLKSEGVSNIEYVKGIHAGNVTLLNLKALLEDPALRVNR